MVPVIVHDPYIPYLGSPKLSAAHVCATDHSDPLSNAFHCKGKTATLDDDYAGQEIMNKRDITSSGNARDSPIAPVSYQTSRQDSPKRPERKTQS